MGPDPAVRRVLEDEGEGVVELLVLPSQMNLHFRRFDVGMNTCAYSGDGRV
jgi:hypothetical protein